MWQDKAGVFHVVGCAGGHSGMCGEIDRQERLRDRQRIISELEDSHIGPLRKELYAAQAELEKWREAYRKQCEEAVADEAVAALRARVAELEAELRWAKDVATANVELSVADAKRYRENQERAERAEARVKEMEGQLNEARLEIDGLHRMKLAILDQRDQFAAENAKLREALVRLGADVDDDIRKSHSLHMGGCKECLLIGRIRQRVERRFAALAPSEDGTL